VPLLHETTLFQEMCAPPARSHTFPRNVCPSCTKPHFSDKCVPLLHETILFCKNTEIRTRGYVNNSRNLPTSRTKRTQGRNIPFEGTPHSDEQTRETWRQQLENITTKIYKNKQKTKCSERKLFFQLIWRCSMFGGQVWCELI